jgi:hypothetical protein
MRIILVVECANGNRVKLRAGLAARAGNRFMGMIKVLPRARYWQKQGITPASVLLRLAPRRYTRGISRRGEQ